MTIKTSTGLRNAMLSGATLKVTMEALVSSASTGFIKLYGGTVPADADGALGGATLLCTVSNASGATGLLFDTAAAAGILAKKPSEAWSGVNVASGTATFYRHVITGDDGTSSTTQKRIQGTIATAGADMNISNPVLVNAAPQALDFYTVALPSG